MSSMWDNIGQREHEIVHHGREMDPAIPKDWWNEHRVDYVNRRPLREHQYQVWCQIMGFDPEDTQSMVLYELAVAA
jgi:hypothetical protein